jgi:mannose/fructose/N-acetylgalactosamine-specific phosphotransferase system component IIC
MFRTIAFIALLSIGAAVPAQAATPAQAAVAAMVAAERAHGQTDIEQPACSIVQTWAQCVFLTASGHLGKTDWLHLKNGKWAFLGGEIGNPIEPYFAKFGVPAAVGKQFEAQCKCR